MMNLRRHVITLNILYKIWILSDIVVIYTKIYINYKESINILTLLTIRFINKIY